jgi:hypothetical protein
VASNQLELLPSETGVSGAVGKKGEEKRVSTNSVVSECR